jgi:outer membrane receptor protein involved in Fe transport
MLKSGRFQTSVSIAIVALCLAATPAMAQGTGDSKGAPPAPPRANGQIAPTTQGADLVVTASRIAKAGYNAPTPVTVVSAEQIKQTAPNDIADALSTLPAFRGLSNRSVDTGTSANGNAGASLLNLRGLGANRTLVLLDGRRVVSSNVSGSTDVNLMPQNLVRSVDVVTGGASAAYGSDAVAGVVNFVLDTKFEGVKAEMQGGISRYGDAGSYRGTIAAGHGFADGRGRVIASLEYFHKNGISTYSTARPWRNDVSAWIPNATGVTTPARVLANGITYSGRSYGGLILNGALKGTDFTANETPTPFIYGSTVSSVFMAGATGRPRSRPSGPAWTASTASCMPSMTSPIIGHSSVRARCRVRTRPSNNITTTMPGPTR